MQGKHKSCILTIIYVYLSFIHPFRKEYQKKRYSGLTNPKLSQLFILYTLSNLCLFIIPAFMFEKLFYLVKLKIITALVSVHSFPMNFESIKLYKGKFLNDKTIKIVD